eukprot:1807365-Prymnesium_polylepis.1
MPQDGTGQQLLHCVGRLAPPTLAVQQAAPARHARPRPRGPLHTPALLSPRLKGTDRSPKVPPSWALVGATTGGAAVRCDEARRVILIERQVLKHA